MKTAPRVLRDNQLRFICSVLYVLLIKVKSILFIHLYTHTQTHTHSRRHSPLWKKVAVWVIGLRYSAAGYRLALLLLLHWS